MENGKNKSRTINLHCSTILADWNTVFADWQMLNSFYHIWPIYSLRRFTGFLTEPFFGFLLGQNKIVKKKRIIATYSCISIFSVFLRSNLVLYRLCLWYNTYITHNWIARKSPKDSSMCVALYCWHGYFIL